MKRSNINKIIKNSIQYLNEMNFYLPQWAYWEYEDWRRNKEKCDFIFNTRLGWDVTFSSHANGQEELVLFTIRNGTQGDLARPYCEKIIIMEENQVIPYHYHKSKTEDIINRSKNPLVFQIGYLNEENKESDIEIMIDGIMHTFKSEEKIILHAGQSLTLYPYYYHQFYPHDKKVLIGEVSKINDDQTDNFFLDDNIKRFPKIEEDEKIIYPLIIDYNNM